MGFQLRRRTRKLLGLLAGGRINPMDAIPCCDCPRWNDLRQPVMDLTNLVDLLDEASTLAAPSIGSKPAERPLPLTCRCRSLLTR